MAIKYRILKRKILIQSVTQAAWKKKKSEYYVTGSSKSFFVYSALHYLKHHPFQSLRRIFYAFVARSRVSNVSF